MNAPEAEVSRRAVEPPCDRYVRIASKEAPWLNEFRDFFSITLFLANTLVYGVGYARDRYVEDLAAFVDQLELSTFVLAG